MHAARLRVTATHPHTMKARFPLLLTVSAFFPAYLQAGVMITPSAGFNIGWDGNDGANFDPAAPTLGAIVPNNLALASNGSTAFTSSQLGVQLGIGYHLTANVNDGFYGNNRSWIAADADPNNPQAFAGVMLPSTFNLDRIAFGRDNGNLIADDCGGQCTDRSLGIYTLQFTADGGVNWTTIGMLNYASDDDGAVGGGFTSYYRHEYAISDDIGNPITANGVRILVPGFGISGAGTDIDEIEVYGRPVPEPTAGILVLAGFAGVLLRRRRS
jgi:hypothetical protein